MAAENTELNTALFMEEVQKYPAIYNKFCKDYKNKFVRMNIWKAIGDKFVLDAVEAEKKYKNLRTAYGRYLRKKRSVPSGSGRDAVPSPAEFSNLDWLANHINQRPSTVTNMQSRVESEDDADHGEEAESPNNVEDSLEYEERSSEVESLLQSERSVSPATDSPSFSAAANGGQPKRSSFCLRISRQNSVVGPRNIADDRASSVFEAIETIVWNQAISSVARSSRIFLRRLRRSGRSGRSYGNQV